MGVPKIMIFFAVIISAALYWATSNVCRYNFALEKRTNILNIVTDEIWLDENIIKGKKLNVNEPIMLSFLLKNIEIILKKNTGVIDAIIIWEVITLIGKYSLKPTNNECK